MWNFFKRLVGRSPEQLAAEKRYAESVKALQESDDRLDELHTQLKELCIEQKERTEELSKTHTDLADTLERANSDPPIMIMDFDDDDERPSGEHVPA